MFLDNLQVIFIITDSLKTLSFCVSSPLPPPPIPPTTPPCVEKLCPLPGHLCGPNATGHTHKVGKWDGRVQMIQERSLLKEVAAGRNPQCPQQLFSDSAYAGNLKTKQYINIMVQLFICICGFLVNNKGVKPSQIQWALPCYKCKKCNSMKNVMASWCRLACNVWRSLLYLSVS